LGAGRLGHGGKSTIRTGLSLAGAALLLGLAACQTASGGQCSIAGQKPTAELVFGRVSNGAPGVSEAQFSKFLQQEISRRFPDGLTVVDAQGRWAPPANGAIRGPSKTVMIVLRGRTDDRDELEAVRTAYAERFHQPSALLLADQGCVSV
jgi:hypothetical protein